MGKLRVTLGQKSRKRLRKEDSLGDCLKDINLQGPWKRSTERHSDGVERALELENPRLSSVLLAMSQGQPEVGDRVSGAFLLHCS